MLRQGKSAGICDEDCCLHAIKICACPEGGDVTTYDLGNVRQLLLPHQKGKNVSEVSSRYRQTCLEFGIRLGLICDRSFSMQGVQDRFRTLENVRLPDMDNRIERAGTALVSKVCTSS